MSELKAYKPYADRYGDMFLYHKDDEDLMLDDEDEVYLKSEVDKVLAEKEADYKEACGRLQTANLIKDEQLAATRHHKYKRCLAMAKWCRTRSYYYSTIRENSLYWGWKADRAYKWYKRWMGIAKKFKEENNAEV